MKMFCLATAIVLCASMALAQEIDDRTFIHSCKIKGFYPGMTGHEKTLLLGGRFGDEALKKHVCFRSEEQFREFYNLDAGESKSLYGPQCMTPLKDLVLDSQDMARVFGVSGTTPEDLARVMAFYAKIFFSFDEATGAYVYNNPKDHCVITIDKDSRLIMTRAMGRPGGK